MNDQKCRWSASSGSGSLDTEQVLGEIADDQGRGEQVRNWFRRPGYVPESLFYLFAGRPERILISSMEERVAALWPHSDTPGM
ncbi:hypothetical protein OHB00_00315 [Streptomyces sp. NBC_00631]|uniref:hypothetical protein n=1 Tax=Streptomyces sp. NBC_00631 TaxID=2975793 RepID=UPI0030E45E90